MYYAGLSKAKSSNAMVDIEPKVKNTAANNGDIISVMVL
jgi:hypothetical protein